MFNNKDEKPSKAQGKQDQAIGGLKEKIGSVFSSDLEAKGRVQKAHGEGEYKLADTMETAEGHADTTKGHVKKAVGGATGDRSLEAEGEKDKIKGGYKKA